MSEVSMLAIDLAKNSFQVCAVRDDGSVVFNRQFRGHGFMSCLHSKSLVLWPLKLVQRPITGVGSRGHKGMTRV